MADDQFISITIEGDKEVDGQLTTIRTLAGDVGATVERGARIIEGHIRDSYRNQRDPWGNPWPPLSPVTIELRQHRNNFSIQPLIDSGATFDSLHTTRVGDNATVEIGGAGLWPNVQQDGNPANKAWGRGRAPIPARPTFPIRAGQADIPQSWIDEVMIPIERELQQAAK